MTSPQVWDLYAIKYATMQERTRRDNFMVSDPHDDAPMPIDYFVWAAVSPEQTIVIDTGFDAPEATARGRTLQRSVTEGLAMVEIEAASVADVIVTHLHYDHIGGHAEFPAAQFHLQESEMQYATGPHMCTHTLNHSFTVGHITDMVRHVFEGRVTFYDGASEIAPGITVHHVGGHTMGLQFVRVLTRRGWVVVASDTTHFYENMERIAPFPIVYNVGDMVRGYAALRAQADTEAHIVPGHDPLVLDRYPAPDARLEGVVVRLDVAPK
ncbi:MAG: N-acyl homoserine lactonase family protein [Alphaproteobacteria bacterium]|nr:N-acyl homoserine lactonase family protein [Alphaproteobacteria bacterium]MCZ6588381.1 N-acyl homoserine lactonase family protein [Alphaproteobacteria bacterium]